MPFNLKWNGAAIVERAQAVAVTSVRETTRATAERAAADHPWRDETGDLSASIHATEPRDDLGEVKAFVVADSPAFFLEVGTVHMPPYPFLRPAADAEYARLVGLIRAGFSL